MKNSSIVKCWLLIGKRTYLHETYAGNPTKPSSDWLTARLQYLPHNKGDSQPAFPKCLKQYYNFFILNILVNPSLLRQFGLDFRTSCSWTIFYVKYAPEALFESTHASVAVWISNMILEHMDLKYSSRLLMVQDHMVQD